jgi:hypothetical protein
MILGGKVASTWQGLSQASIFKIKSSEMHNWMVRDEPIDGTAGKGRKASLIYYACMDGAEGPADCVI